MTVARRHNGAGRPFGPARRAALAALALSLGLGLVSAGAVVPAGAQEETDETATPKLESTAALPDLDVIDPVRFSYDDAIIEHAFVSTRTGTPVGTGTGLSPSDTQIWVDIIRPDTDEPVPTVMISSPYFNTLGRGWRGQLKTPTSGLPGTGPEVGGRLGGGSEFTPFPEWYDEYFVKRGYAVALMDLRGTRNSSGCQVYGDRDEVLDTVDVIDFLAAQDWSNGKVGMTGGSYDGTIAFGAASEHAISGQVPGALGAIIPIRAIGRWYDYHFFNGVQSQSHAATPALFTAALAAGDNSTATPTDDLLLPLHLVERKACIATVGAAVDAGYATPYQDTSSAFWTERDFVSNAADYDTAVFAIHGLFDFNVKTHTVGYAWESMTGAAPKKLWLADMDHADPHIPTPQDAISGGHLMPYPFQQKFIDATHRWYLQFLKGVDAGALDMPLAETQQWDGTWLASETWPPASTDLVLYPQPDGTLVTEAPEDGTATWNDGPTSNAPASFTVVSEVFEEPTRIAGQIAVELDLAAQGPDTTVAVQFSLIPEGVDPARAVANVAWDWEIEPAIVAQYAWARAFYRDSIAARGVSSPTGGSPLTPNAAFELDFASSHTDVTIPAGYQLAVTFDNSLGGTVAANTAGTVTMAMGAESSRILLPIADAVTVAPPAPAPVAAPAPVPAPAPLPATGGGAALLGVAALALAVTSRRPRLR